MDFPSNNNSRQSYSIGTDWVAFWLSLAFTVFGTLVGIRAIFGSDSFGDYFLHSLELNLYAIIPAVIVGTPLSYLYARASSVQAKRKNIGRFVLAVILLTIIGTVAFFYLGMGSGAGGWALVGYGAIAAAVVVVSIVKALGLRLLLKFSAPHQKKIQYILFALIVVIYFLQFMGWLELSIPDDI